MIRPITVGLDRSPESLAAADWAAREALRRAVPLHLVHAWIWQPHDVPVAQNLDTQKHWALRVLRQAEEDLRGGHPELAVSAEQISDTAAEVLLGQAEKAQMLVLGSGSRRHCGVPARLRWAAGARPGEQPGGHGAGKRRLGRQARRWRR
ncbi:universal stress protein [Streptomyces sp. NBC_00444]|uniref:universal stress protein n=1 Tax=Streptomyces sp. NBC_00444 TaxID=2975744 RepID=UPI002E1FB1A9